MTRTRTKDRQMPLFLSHVTARRLAEIRKRRGWSQEDLARRTGELGAAMTQSTIARTELGRNVSLNETLALAAALGVAPTSLFLPLESAELVAITPERIVPARHARRWVRGQAPLVADDARVYAEEVDEEEWRARQDTSLAFLLDRVQELVDATIAEDREAMADAVDDLNAELARIDAAQRRRERRAVPPSDEVRKVDERRKARREERDRRERGSWDTPEEQPAPSDRSSS